ncbi:hypothetical protein DPMN_076483 [Dreissena polymorpha]|uniref:Uncharacterized protein n=1 Tax=Dreissena polymorpha TaxID=45954 RepID=A0A9D4BMF7_DREPO|nr:hypothetical protein DPMN_076483 [Dreissena polymorpha]
MINVPMKFHDPRPKRSWAKNVTSRRPCFFTDPNHCRIVQDINKTNVLTNFHDDWAKIVTSRVFTRENCHYIHIMKNAPPTGGHVFSPIWTIFELVRDINKTNVLTNFHDDWTKIVTSRKNAPPTGGHAFSPIWTILELVRDINKNNVLTTFHDDWDKIVTSRVFTRKTAPPTGGHVFQQTGTTFELNQDIITTNILTNFELGRDFIGAKLLTKFHEDGTRNVASSVYDRVGTNRPPPQMLTDGRTMDKDRSEKLT